MIVFDSISNTRTINSTIGLLDYLSFNLSNARMLSSDYVITHDTAYLTMYETCRQNILSQAKQLPQSIESILGKKRNLESLIYEINETIRRSDYYISLKKRNIFESIDLINKVIEDKKSRSRVNSHIDRLISLEKHELLKQESGNSNKLHTFEYGFYVLTFGIIALLFFTLFFILYNFKKVKKAQTLITESEERFEKFFNLSPVATSISEISSTKILYVNNAFEQLFAVKREDAIGKTADELGISTKAEKEALTKEVTASKGKNHLELIRKSITGEQKNIYGSIDIIDVNGQQCLLSCMIDITEQKRHEKELQKANELFSVLFNENPIGVIISRLTDGKIFDCNKAYTDLLGYPKNELVGKKIEDLNILVKPGVRAIIAEQIKQQKRVNNFDLEVRTKNGEVISGLLSGQLITINGEAYILVILKDNTLYKKAEKDMLSALAKERELSQMKSDFVALASHEFRTPLSTIQSSADLLTMYLDTHHQDERLRHVKRIQLSVQKLTLILQEFLTVEKIEAGNAAPSLRPLNIKELITGTCKDMQLNTKHGQIINYKHVGNEHIISDPEFLQHILTNLISNAIKYSPINTTVSILSRSTSSVLTIVVKDKGLGIPKEDQKNLFTRFYRASNTLSIQGTGLGLYIAKRYTEQLGGNITLVSELNKGAQFIVSLPLSNSIILKKQPDLGIRLL